MAQTTSMSDGIMPRRKLMTVWDGQRYRLRCMTEQEAFEQEREMEGPIAALDNWRYRQQPVWLLIAEGARG